MLHLQSKRGLLRRVLNSGLLLREGYSTPEAGKRLLFNRTFFCNRISFFNRISFVTEFLLFLTPSRRCRPR